eukprot:scaffold21444_cov64-Skeletonema_marinoi.AAC.1
MQHDVEVDTTQHSFSTLAPMTTSTSEFVGPYHGSVVNVRSVSFWNLKRPSMQHRHKPITKPKH